MSSEASHIPQLIDADLIDKLGRVRDKILSERGSMRLFGIFLRNDSVTGVKDLLVSADWLKPQTIDGFEYVSKILKSELSESDMLQISSIVIVKTNDPILAKMANIFEVHAQGALGLQNIVLNDVLVTKAVIFWLNKG